VSRKAASKTRNNYIIGICIAHAMTCIVLAMACFKGVTGNSVEGILLIMCALISLSAGYITVLNKWVQLFVNWKHTVPFAITGLVTIIVPVIILPWLSIVLVIICTLVLIYKKGEQR